MLAILATLLFALLLGMISVVQAFQAKEAMDGAVREAARHLATSGTSWAEAESRAVATLNQELAVAGLSDMATNVTCVALIPAGQPGCWDGGKPTVAPAAHDQVVVEVQFTDYPFRLGILTVGLDFEVRTIARHRR